MTGERNLTQLLKTMQPVMDPNTYVFATLPSDQTPKDLPARMIFQEAEGTTLIITRTQAEAFDLAFEFPSRMITLNVHSSLDAVGFLAHITTRLAAEMMGVNPVSGFFHDHLFVPEDRAADAMDVLKLIISES